MAPPSHDAPRWVEQLRIADVPVLAASRDALAHWSSRREAVDAHRLADIALRDPLLALRVLAQASCTLGERLSAPVETVTAALLLLGVEPFFRAHQDLPTVEAQLAGQPDALAGACASVERAHRAARLAAAFAIHRQDDQAEALLQAALLNDVGALLLWCLQPEAALRIAALQREDPALRTDDAQRTVLGRPLSELSRVVAARWALPPRLREAHPGAQAHAVRLAVRIARHLDTGWDNAALPDDFRDAGRLLNLTPAQASALVRDALDDGTPEPESAAAVQPISR